MSIDQMKNPDAPKQIRDPNTLKELDDLIKGGDPAKVVKYIKTIKKKILSVWQLQLCVSQYSFLKMMLPGSY